MTGARGESGSASKPPDRGVGPVTTIVTRRVKPGHEGFYEQFLEGIIAAASGFPGHLGVEVFRPQSAAAGEVTELRCTYDPATKGGNAPDGRKVQATLHWVSATDAISADVRIYNQLFTRPDPDAGNFTADLNPQSLEVLADAKLEPALAADNSENPVQFERQGYLYRDPDSAPGRLVFNRTVGLRDTWAKVAAAAKS